MACGTIPASAAQHLCHSNKSFEMWALHTATHVTALNAIRAISAALSAESVSVGVVDSADLASYS